MKSLCSMILTTLLVVAFVGPALAADKPANDVDAPCHYQTGQGTLTNQEWHEVQKRCLEETNGHWIVVKGTPTQPSRPYRPYRPWPVIPQPETPDPTTTVARQNDATATHAGPAQALLPRVWSSDYIAPHFGSTIFAWFDKGVLEVLDHFSQSSLRSANRCVGNQATLLASSGSLELWCTGDNQYRVVQTTSPHPADGRLDQLVFDAALTECSRSYWYLGSGAVETWLSGC